MRLIGQLDGNHVGQILFGGYGKKTIGVEIPRRGNFNCRWNTLECHIHQGVIDFTLH